MARSMITASDQIDMMKRMITTAFAGMPILAHISGRLKPTLLPWS
jgi:hypothetical protein